MCVQTIVKHSCGHDATGFNKHSYNLILCAAVLDDSLQRSLDPQNPVPPIPCPEPEREEVRIPILCERCDFGPPPELKRKEEVRKERKPSIRLSARKREAVAQPPAQEKEGTRRQKDSVAGPAAEDAVMVDAPAFTAPGVSGGPNFNAPPVQQAGPARKSVSFAAPANQQTAPQAPPIDGLGDPEAWAELADDKRAQLEAMQEYAQELMAEKQRAWEAGELVKYVQRNGEIKWCMAKDWSEELGDRRYP